VGLGLFMVFVFRRVRAMRFGAPQGAQAQPVRRRAARGEGSERSEPKGEGA